MLAIQISSAPGFILHWALEGHWTAVSLTVLTPISAALDGPLNSYGVRVARLLYLVALLPVATLMAWSRKGRHSLFAALWTTVACCGRGRPTSPVSHPNPIQSCGEMERPYPFVGRRCRISAKLSSSSVPRCVRATFSTTVIRCWSGASAPWSASRIAGATSTRRRRGRRAHHGDRAHDGRA
jgi:hypothetical protein